MTLKVHASGCLTRDIDLGAAVRKGRRDDVLAKMLYGILGFTVVNFADYGHYYP